MEKFNLQNFAGTVDSSEGLAGTGTKVEVKFNGTAEFVEVADVRTIPQMGADTQKIDVTTLADDRTKQIEGIQGAQNLQFQLVYKGKNFKALQAHSGDRKQHDFKVTYPDGLTCTFKGSYVVYVNQLSTNAAVQFNMNVTVSDGPNFDTAGVTATPGGDGGHH